ncbi:MAG: glycosyltransferase family 4 protein, partial [Solirubrobacterales bacterium]
MADSSVDSGGYRRRRRGSVLRRSGARVVSVLFFFPRGGSAQVARALCRALPGAGWDVTLAAGSLGGGGDPRNALGFFSGIDVIPVDYSPALEVNDPTAAGVPFQPSYEDRPGAPDRVFAAVDDEAYERLVSAWAEALDRAGTAEADLLHLHHLTPANEAALRAHPGVPVVGQLHGTELALLRAIEAGAPSGWRFAGRWAARLRRWARACERLIVPPGAAVGVARLLGVPPDRIAEIPSGVELELFDRQPLGRRERLAHWR